jgi:tRNA-specific 2-thiouridylase
VAQHLGINFDELNFVDRFRTEVINYFAAEYKAGRTPIPCIVCGSRIRLGPTLLEFMNSARVEYIATGHYVRQVDGRIYAANSSKDQSYFLWNLPAELLSRMWFPINTTKEETRAYAANMNLPVANKPDSQDICFVPGGDYTAFLFKHDPYFAPRKGKIVDQSGKTLGTHLGHWNFTVGQRKGISVPSTVPLYVLSIDAAVNTVVVGPADALPVSRFLINSTNYHGTPTSTMFVKLRAHGKYVQCQVQNNVVVLETPEVVTPGQAAVFYTNTQAGFRLEGGGWITGPV